MALLSIAHLTNAQEHVYADAKNTNGYSRQSKRSLHDVLPEIQAHFNISFVYESGVIEGKEVAGEIPYSNNIEKTLNTVLIPVGLKYRKVNRSTYSILSNSTSSSTTYTGIAGSTLVTNSAGGPVLDLDSNEAFTSLSDQEVVDILVTGRVTDAESGPIPGANILIKGTGLGTTTDTDGKFSINVPDASSVLVISFIGYLSKEVVVGNQTDINVSLEADIQQLGEVVVVGYGTQKKASITSAISSVSAKDISVQPVTNVGQALQGRMAGVTVVNNGAPGEAPVVRIRGIGTINNANPLFVVDGFPTGDINSINPKDIQSVDVLKDAAAAAIYGSRGSNGVIIITTKGGANNQKMTINFDSYYGVEQPWRKLDLLNTEQYIDYATDLTTNADIYFNENNDPVVSNTPDRVVGVSVPTRIQTGLDQPINSQSSQTYRETNTNWQDEMFRTGRIQQHKVELAGGSATSKMFGSLGYYEQEGIMLGTGYKRGDARFNSDHNVSKRVTVGQNFYVAFDERKIEQQSGGRTQLQHIIRSSPYFPVYSPDNYGGFWGAQAVDGSDPENPVRVATMDKQNQQRLKFLGNAYVDIKLFDFLTYRFKGGVDYVDYTQRSHSPAYNTGGGYSSRTNAIINQNRQHFTSVLLTSQLTFNKAFGKHSVNAIAVAEQQTSNFSQITGGGENAVSNDITQPGGLSGISFNGNGSESAIISYIGRVNYEYNGKYLIGASFRRDGSSRFAPDERWGSFPAVSAGWRVSEEAFLANNDVISDLKIRASYGAAGNNVMPNNNDYAWQSTISGNQIYQFSGATPSTGYTIRNLSNAALHWEKTYMTNIGFDMGILNNQFTLSVELFNNKTTDMIIGVPVPLSFGYDGNPVANIGEVENKGYEIELGYEKSQGDFTFSASGNLSVVRNEVLDLGEEGTTIATGDWYGDNLSLTEVGKPIGYFNGYVMDGLFQEGESTAMQPNARPGDIRFKDVNEDGELNSEDKINVGHFLPNFSYGVNFNANWKGFDASLFLQGVSGNEIYSIVKYDLEGMTRLFNSGKAVLDRWTPENTNTNVPRAISADPNQNARASNRFVEDGSYFRIKNLTLGYNFSSVASMTKNALTRLRVYTTMQNLLTITKYDAGYDPEIGIRNGANLTAGVDYGQFPQARSIVVGLQVGF